MFDLQQDVLTCRILSVLRGACIRDSLVLDSKPCRGRFCHCESMNSAATRQDSFTATLAEAARHNVETTLGACNAFRRWHRENFVLKRPTLEQVAEHGMDVRILLLMLRWLQATVADPGTPARDLLPRVEVMLRLLEDCWQYVHEPMSKAEAEKLLAEVFPE